MARSPFSIREFKGLDNKHDPKTLVEIEKKQAAAYATAATNVDFDVNFGVTRRRGWSLELPGICHSLWTSPDKAYTLVVKDGVLGLLDTSLNFTALQAASDRFFAYTDTGAGIYMSDGQSIYRLDTSGPSLDVMSRAGTYDPSTRVVDADEDEVIYDHPLPGTVLQWMFGRLWVANEYGVFYSRAYRPDQFNLANDYLDLRNITMIAPVDDGYYLGTQELVYFVAGTNPKMPTPTAVVCDIGAIPRSAAVLPASQFKEGAEGDVVVWESIRGKLLGRNSGAVEFMIDEHVAYPTADYAATLLREMNGEVHHIAALANKNTEGSNMRATDIAVAEVRRNGILI